ncbi:hypothetical protein M5K25_025937 [Dendrobium thyrsiflorum]|uniref:Uncharacterized protein n=1 Tax=Dendrobium thyrsiflorum TaxID=117978 RepID=A0ABD0TVZ7_DENTH
MKEECTPAYIAGVQELFCGSWVCGLCAEAVKENMKRLPPSQPSAGVLRRALDSHMEFCKKFNGTTRLNPKLSFAGTMREIARKSSLHRSSGGGGGGGIARTRSCGPFMDVKFDSNV